MTFPPMVMKARRTRGITNSNLWVVSPSSSASTVEQLELTLLLSVSLQAKPEVATVYMGSEVISNHCVDSMLPKTVPRENNEMKESFRQHLSVLSRWSCLNKLRIPRKRTSSFKHIFFGRKETKSMSSSFDLVAPDTSGAAIIWPRSLKERSTTRFQREQGTAWKPVRDSLPCRTTSDIRKELRQSFSRFMLLLVKFLTTPCVETVCCSYIACHHVHWNWKTGSGCTC